MRTWVNFGAQKFGAEISRLQGISENANMLLHDMQPNALLIWQYFLSQKVGVIALKQSVWQIIQMGHRVTQWVILFTPNISHFAHAT
jgi:Holliday junction resolvasome RuvABC endonuclease subunit